MSMPRRRIIRPAPETVSIDLQRQRQLDRLRSRLSDEQNSLARWQTGSSVLLPRWQSA